MIICICYTNLSEVCAAGLHVMLHYRVMNSRNKRLLEGGVLRSTSGHVKNTLHLL